MGLVSFSNTSRLEFPLTALADTRARLADSVPDKYRYGQDGRQVP